MLKIDSEKLKAVIRKTGKLVRSGRATEAEALLLDRTQRVRDYLWSRQDRGQPKQPMNGWWNLPIAAHMWAADARQIKAI